MCRRICEKEGKAVAVSETCDGGWRERWTLVLTVQSDWRVNRLASLSAPLSFFLLLSAVLFFLSYQFPRTLRFFQFNVLRWQKSREPKLRDNRSTFPPLSFSLSFSPSLSSCVCRTLSRGGGVEEERKRFIFILSSFSILPQGKNNLTSFILHLTVSPSPPSPSLSHTL